jgi:hypothetical protein
MYRTKTYIAGDWTGDQDLISQLYKWNDDNRLLLSFVDAHELTQANDSSLACSIKSSLRERLQASKTFVLIVGKQTKDLRAGSCKYCASYNGYTGSCARGNNVDYRSFIEFECEMAVKDYLNNELSKIVVLYNFANVDKEKCPECIKDYGTHLNAYYYSTDGKCYWNYPKIKEAICG